MALVPHLSADASIADHILYYNEADSDPEVLVEGTACFASGRTTRSICTRCVRYAPKAFESPSTRARKNNNPKCARDPNEAPASSHPPRHLRSSAATARVP